MCLRRAFDQTDILTCGSVSMMPCISEGDELLIIAFWLAMKLVEHIGDLKRSERHVSISVITVVKY